MNKSEEKKAKARRDISNRIEMHRRECLRSAGEIKEDLKVEKLLYNAKRLKESFALESKYK